MSEYATAGMDGVAPKPVDMANLYAVMEQILAAADAAQWRAERPEAAVMPPGQCS